MNLDEALNFVDDEITRRVHEMTKRFKNRLSKSPKPGPSNSTDPSFMFSPGIIEPIETYKNRVSDSFLRHVI